MKNLLKEESIDSLVKESKILILQFGTSTCAPCAAIKEKIDIWSVDKKIVNSRYVSIEEYPEIAAEQGIFSAPTVLVFVEGKLTIREAGYFSLEEIFMRIERYSNILQND
ncbi:MAG: thioredoxin family protein [Butyrivibrio sp.]|nr:thioredoxin family protein [Butyrivibrio sp.]